MLPGKPEGKNNSAVKGGLLLLTVYKQKSQMDWQPKCECKIINVSEGYIEEYLYGLMNHKIFNRKTRMYEYDIKVNNFCSRKETTEPL